jgi:hypothetical protein
LQAGAGEIRIRQMALREIAIRQVVPGQQRAAPAWLAHEKAVMLLEHPLELAGIQALPWALDGRCRVAHALPDQLATDRGVDIGRAPSKPSQSTKI